MKGAYGESVAVYVVINYCLETAASYPIKRKVSPMNSETE